MKYHPISDLKVDDSVLERLKDLHINYVEQFIGRILSSPEAAKNLFLYLELDHITMIELYLQAIDITGPIRVE